MAETFDTIEDVKIPCLLNSKVNKGRYLLVERIGSGGYSIVYLAVDLFSRVSSGPTHVAVKCVLDRPNPRLTREIELHYRAAAASPGVIDLYRTFREDGLFFLVLEYCPHGDLFSTLTESNLFLGNNNAIKLAFLQLLDTVADLHRRGIYHRDLKPENILCLNSPLEVYNGQASVLQVLIADFGLATDSERSKSFGCGSYFYMTPECLAGAYSSGVRAYSSRAADIWALGVILVNLICGRAPWKAAMLSDNSYNSYTNDNSYLRRTFPLSVPALEFLNKIFNNHGNRIDLMDLRRQFCDIDSLYMTDEEIAVADKTVRLVASEWIPSISPSEFTKEDHSKIVDLGQVDEHDLFYDNIHVQPSEAVSDIDSASTWSSSTGTCQFVSASSFPDGTPDSGSESELPATPQTKPVSPKDDVPKLKKSQKPVSGRIKSWVLASTAICKFHKPHFAPTVQDTPEMERLDL